MGSWVGGLSGVVNVIGDGVRSSGASVATFGEGFDKGGLEVFEERRTRFEVDMLIQRLKYQRVI